MESLGLGVLAWSPLGRGITAGKYRHNTPTESRGASPQWQGFIDGLRSKSDRIVEAVITAAGLGPAAGGGAGVGPRPAGRGGAHRRCPHRPAAAGLAGLGGRAPAAAIRTALEDVSAPPFSYPERRTEG